MEEKSKSIFRQTISEPVILDNTLSFTRIVRKQVKVPKNERIDKTVKYKMQDIRREICMVMDLNMFRNELHTEIIDIMGYDEDKKLLSRFYDHYDIPFFSKKHHLHPAAPETITKECFKCYEREFNLKKHNSGLYEKYLQAFENMSDIDSILDDIENNVFLIIEDPGRYVSNTIFNSSRDLYNTIDHCVKKYLKVEKIEL